MDLELAGKAVLISGGASGIGLACATGFAREGARVAVLDWNRDALADVETLLKGMGADPLCIAGDVSVAGQVEAAHDEVIDAFGGIDVAVNNAGIGSPSTPIEETSEDAWDSVIGVNLKGVWLCVRAQVRHMRPRNSGVIVNTASTASVVGSPGTTPYTAAKHGVLGITRTAALELADAGVRVNAVAPATVDTPLGAKARLNRADPFADALMRKGQPVGRNARADEIADAVLWLASARATFVTGSTLVIDGGFTAQ